MIKLLAIALGGAIGALFRYGLSGAVHAFLSGMYPWGTLAVNLIGSFLIGFLWHVSEEVILAPHLKMFVFVGILGGFTTFSTYMLETMHLLRDGETGLALGNLLLSNLLGIMLVFAGFMLSQYVLTLFK
ncbi:fluoride efflux transporter CrcB [Thermodesulfobacteriota bacterium]